MNILYAGNLVNVGYYHVRQLRKMRIDIDLLMEKDPPNNSNPLLRDPNLQSYPDWIIFYDKKRTNWKFQIIKKMRDSKYDLIHAHVELPIFAYLSRRKFITQTLGSDLSEMAFSNTIRGFLLRRAYRKAKVVIFSTPDQPVMLNKIGIKNTIYLPIISDPSFFQPLSTVDKRYSDKFVIFHPANHIWSVKGNDILIRGFAEFAKNHSDALLIAIDFGIDREKSKTLIKSLGIEDRVIFFNKMNGPELLFHYNISDVIADQFISDGLGGIGMEALSCKKPLIVKSGRDAYQDLLPESPPVLDASTPDEIRNHLEYLRDKNIRIKIGENGRRWMEKYFSPELIARKSMIIYESVVNNEPIEKIREKILQIT